LLSGSGVDIDVCKDTPYESYAEISFKKIVYKESDAWARMMVRLEEVEERINIIDYAVDHLPSGPIKIDLPRSVSASEAANVLACAYSS
jgi:NADH:ubiquinone oxidoreductase subunit D